MRERLQKILARAGLGSRRQIEDWIRDGRIQVNGVVAQLGDQAGEHDKIELDGVVIKKQDLRAVEQKVILYHKPEGEITTRSDPEGRVTVFEHLPRLKTGRWVAIGRLDINTSGVLLLTTDGELANRLMHPSSQVEREYAVRVLGEVEQDVLDVLQQGVELEDGVARFESIKDSGGQGANHWYHVTLHEGRNREVRRLWESQGITVSRLIRIRFANINLPRNLRPGRWKDLDEREMRELYQLAGLKVQSHAKTDEHEARKNSKTSKSWKRPVAARRRKSDSRR